MMRPATQRPLRSAPVATARLVILLAVLALLLIGCVMVFSVTSVSLVDSDESVFSNLKSHLVFIAIGVVFAIILWKLVPYRIYNGNFVWVVWAISIVLLLVTSFFGTDQDTGATRWLGVGEHTVQPSELVKIGLLIVAVRIAYDFRCKAKTTRVIAIQAFLLVAIPLAFLYKTQSDLGTTLIVAVGILAVMLLGGVRRSVLLAICAVGFICVLVAIFGTDYRSGRMVYLDPWNDGEDGLGSGYNIIRSYYAIAEGGIFGVGLGNGYEKYQYLYASESDFIYSIICEETGMVGALTVLALYIAILFAGLRIASSIEERFGSMLAGSLTIMLVFQAFLNMGCAIGVLPTTGKPLPFISSGGSALIASLAMIGIILSVTEAPIRTSVYDRRRADLRLIRNTERIPTGYADLRADRRRTYPSQAVMRASRR